MVCLGFFMTSCDKDQMGRVNLYDQEEILNEGDSYSSSDYQNSDRELRLKDFSGTYTVKTFDFCTEISLTLDWEIQDGHMRVLWITPENEIIELEKGVHHFEVRDGMTRLKIIADDITGEFNWVISYL